MKRTIVIPLWVFVAESAVVLLVMLILLMGMGVSSPGIASTGAQAGCWYTQADGARDFQKSENPTLDQATCIYEGGSWQQ